MYTMMYFALMVQKIQQGKLGRGMTRAYQAVQTRRALKTLPLFSKSILTIGVSSVPLILMTFLQSYAQALVDLLVKHWCHRGISACTLVWKSDGDFSLVPK